MIPQQAVDEALRAFDARGDEPVLDLVADSDLEPARLRSSPRRLRFRRDGLGVDALVAEPTGAEGLRVLVRVTPRRPFTVRATSRGHGLTVVAAVAGRADDAGIARLDGLPHGVTSLRVEGLDAAAPVRTAWVRL